MPTLVHPSGEAAASPRLDPLSDPLAAADLRRRRPAALAALVVERSRHVAPADAALLLAVYRDAAPARTIAALRGWSARRVRRRVRNLVLRVLSPQFEFVAEQIDSWPPDRARVARAVVFEGRSLRAASRHLGMTLHHVRRHAGAVRLLCEAGARQGGGA